MLPRLIKKKVCHMDVHAVHKHSHTYTQVTPGPFPGHELFTYVLPSAHVQLHVSMFWLEKIFLEVGLGWDHY